MAWTLLFTNLFVILLAAGLRYGGAAPGAASPIAMGEHVWWWAVAGAAAVALALGLWDRKRLTHRPARRAAMELLIFPALFAFEWSVLPQHHWRTADWAVMAAFVGAIGVMFWADRRNFRQWGVTGRNFLPAVKLLVLPTVVMMAAPVVVAAFVGTDFRWPRLADSLLYPLYALGQLLIFQVFLVVRLRRLSDSHVTVILVAAGVFALLHWPNGVVMAACFAAAAVWTAVYLRRPNVYALALSMGLAAGAFANALPRKMTENLRTGPRCVHKRLGEARQGEHR
ncbi:MAG: CPBP family intramembrane metalloprotease [Phycisphaerae bacterium]|nr:CPBP family intramembrane metalloprotease [Phycisphaerae bacterium]